MTLNDLMILSMIVLSILGGTFISWCKQLLQKKTIRMLKTPVSVIDWDEEFLRSEAKKHQLDKIERCKVVFTFGKPGKPQDGMKWICICGANKGCHNLTVAEHSFKTHQNKMREIALAELGRFK